MFAWYLIETVYNYECVGSDVIVQKIFYIKF